MSRGCYKTYGRKVGPTSHASIQFDKLFSENTNKPCAAKSAGTVGKWGVTSFTSIRSTNFTLGIFYLSILLFTQPRNSPLICEQTYRCVF